MEYYDLIDFDETFYYEEELVSGKPVDAKAEVERRFDANVLLWGPDGQPTGWDADKEGAYVDLHQIAGRVERVDQNNVKYFLDLKPGKKQVVSYKVTYKRRKVGPELNTERKREPLGPGEAWPGRPQPRPPIIPQPVPLPGVGVIRVKAGTSIPFTDSSGNVWKAEEGFDGGGRMALSNRSIANTNDRGLYLSYIFGMGSFTCEVPNGRYIAKLYFVEEFVNVTGPGQRIFSFNVQGHDFNDFNVWAKAGGLNRAYVESVPVEVTDGKFKITFTGKFENRRINAIEIIPQGGP